MPVCRLWVLMAVAFTLRLAFTLGTPAWKSADEYPHFWVAEQTKENEELPYYGPAFPRYEAFQPVTAAAMLAAVPGEAGLPRNAGFSASAAAGAPAAFGAAGCGNGLDCLSHVRRSAHASQRRAALVRRFSRVFAHLRRHHLLGITRTTPKCKSSNSNGNT